MKKLTFFLILTMVSFSTFAQYNNYILEEPIAKSSRINAPKLVKHLHQNKNASETLNSFWSEDFENGFPEGWTNSNNATDESIGSWVLTDSTYPGAYIQDLNEAHIYGSSAPSGNKFMHFPIDYYHCTVNPNGSVSDNGNISPVDGTLETPWIDISEQENIALRFATWFKLWDGGLIGGVNYPGPAHWEVSISTNGNSWTTLNVREFGGIQVASREFPPQNNEQVAYFHKNITSLVNGAEQMKIRFRVYNTISYFVSLDDIELFVPASNDIALSDVYAVNTLGSKKGVMTTSSFLLNGAPGMYAAYNTNYSEVPCNIRHKVHLGGYLYQNGLQGDDVHLDFYVDSMDVANIRSYASSSTIQYFTSGEDSILYSDTSHNFINSPSFYNPELGYDFFEENDLLLDGIEYLFKYEASSINTDEVPENNTRSLPYAQTLGRYSYHHKSSINAYVGEHNLLSNKEYFFPQHYGDAVLNDFDFFTDEAFKIYGVRVFIANDAVHNTYDANGDGVQIAPVIYKLDFSSMPPSWVKFNISSEDGYRVLREEDQGKYIFLKFKSSDLDEYEFESGYYRVGFEVSDYNIENGTEKGFAVGCDGDYRQARLHASYYADDQFKRLSIPGSLMIDAYTSLEQFEFDKNISTTQDTKVPLSQKESIKIYPNPSHGLIKITNAENAKIELYSITGNMIQATQSKDQHTQIDISSLKTGTYIVKVIKHNKVFTSKINVL